MCAGAFVEQISLSAPASGCACGQALGWLFRQHGGRIEVFRERPDELHSHTHIACKSQIFNDSKRHNIRELLGFLKGRFPGEGPHRRFQGADESDFLIVPWVHTTWGSQGLQKIPSTWCQDTKDIDLLRQDRTEVFQVSSHALLRNQCFTFLGLWQVWAKAKVFFGSSCDSCAWLRTLRLSPGGGGHASASCRRWNS